MTTEKGKATSARKSGGAKTKTQRGHYQTAPDPLSRALADHCQSAALAFEGATFVAKSLPSLTDDEKRKVKRHLLNSFKRGFAHGTAARALAALLAED